jgi:hypothetical protein
MVSAPYIVVAGNIAAGKTTLVRWLADELGVPRFEERPALNPFFDRFYADPPRWAFDSQMWFLNDSLHRHHAIARGGAGGVEDRCAHEVMEVFSRQLHDDGALERDELARIAARYRRGCRRLVPPDAVVLLDAPPDTLARRILVRGREAEVAGVGRAYLKRLRRRYDALFQGWSASPLIRVDTSRVDLRVRSGRSWLLGELRETLSA